MAWHAPLVDINDLQNRFHVADQKVNELRQAIAQKGVQVSGVDDNVRFKVIFDMLEEMGWPRILMDVMVAEGILGAFEQVSDQIDEQIRQAQLAAQAQGKEVRTQQGIVLPGAGMPPNIPGNGRPPT